MIEMALRVAAGVIALMQWAYSKDIGRRFTGKIIGKSTSYVMNEIGLAAGWSPETRESINLAAGWAGGYIGSGQLHQDMDGGKTAGTTPSVSEAELQD